MLLVRFEPDQAFQEHSVKQDAAAPAVVSPMANLDALIARGERMYIVRISETRKWPTVEHQQWAGIRDVQRGPLVRKSVGNDKVECVLSLGVGCGNTVSIIRIVLFIPINAELGETLLLKKPILQVEACALISGPHLLSLSCVGVEP